MNKPPGFESRRSRVLFALMSGLVVGVINFVTNLLLHLPLGGLGPLGVFAPGWALVASFGSLVLSSIGFYFLYTRYFQRLRSGKQGIPPTKTEDDPTHKPRL